MQIINKSSNNQDFFIVEIEMLKNSKVFPFHLYIFDEENSCFNIFLTANTPLVEDRFKFMNESLEQGHKLSVLMKQKRTFLKAMRINESDVPSLRDIDDSPYARKEIQDAENSLNSKRKSADKASFNEDDYRPKNNKQEAKSEEKVITNTPFDFANITADSISKDDFSEIIKRTRLELIELNENISHTVSLARYLGEHLLQDDNFINRVVAVSYQLTKLNKFNDPEVLSDIVCAAYLSHIGYTQMNRYLISASFSDMSLEEKKKAKKHTALSTYLIKKSGINISKRCLTVIEQHHERPDGRGYPEGMVNNSIDPLALILGAVLHIFEFSGGLINGEKQSIDKVIALINSKANVQGLEHNFGENVIDALIPILQKAA